jgi:hypothetical protein
LQITFNTRLLSVLDFHEPAPLSKLRRVNTPRYQFPHPRRPFGRFGTANTLWLAVLLASCRPDKSAEPSRLPSTRIEIQIRSDFAPPLGRIDVATFDETGLDMSEQASVTVDQTFVVVRAPGSHRAKLRVVASGYAPSGELLIIQRMLVEFSRNQVRRYELWLRQACESVTCTPDQTCEAGHEAAPVCVDLLPAEPISEQSSDGDATTPPTRTVAGTTPAPSSSNGGGTSRARSSDAGSGGQPTQGREPRATYADSTPDRAALTSGGEPRRNAPKGSASALLLYDDGFELQERVCNANDLCVTAGFEP